jgi:hypothetical protein
MATAAFEIKDEQRPLNEIPVSLPNEEESTEDAITAEGDESTEQLTVFHSADNFNVKHPLMNKWTLWFTKPPSGKVCGSLSTELPELTEPREETTGVIY